MKQFFKILRFELKNYFKNKVFMGITIFFAAALIIVMFAPRVIDVFKSEPPTPDVGGSGETVEGERPIMYLGGDAALVNGAKELFSSAFPAYTVKATADDENAVKALIEKGEAKCAFFLKSPVSYRYLVQNVELYDANTAVADELMVTVYRMNAMINGGLTPEEAGEILSVAITHDVLNIGGKDQMKNFVYAYVMIFTLYMVIILYGQMVASNVATEKSSRAMELLITSAKPTSMMFGKVIASSLAGLFQLTAIFGSALASFSINSEYWGNVEMMKSFFDMPVSLLLYMLLFFLLGFFFYAFLFGAVASTVSKLEDINMAVTPIMLPFIIGFIIVMMSMAGGKVDSLIMRIFSYLPITSPMAMFTRIAMGTVPAYEIIISVAVLLVSVVGVGILAAKIYRVGVLLYGNRPKFREILKMLKKS